MNNVDIKERTISAIQRDRLSEFLKQSREENSGCFYNSLLTSWNNLEPDKIISKQAIEQILEKDNLSVHPKEVLSIIKKLEGELGLEVSRVLVTKYSNITIEETRKQLNIPNNITITKGKEKGRTTSIESADGGSALLYWRTNKDDSAHYTSIEDSSRLQEIEEETGTIGGQKSTDFLTSEGYSPTLVFFIQKIS